MKEPVRHLSRALLPPFLSPRLPFRRHRARCSAPQVARHAQGRPAGQRWGAGEGGGDRAAVQETELRGRPVLVITGNGRGLEGDRRGQSLRVWEDTDSRKEGKTRKRGKRESRLKSGPVLEKSCNLPNNTNLLSKITQ
jgi:hypothetical protein